MVEYSNVCVSVSVNALSRKSGGISFTFPPLPPLPPSGMDDISYENKPLIVCPDDV